MSDDAIISQRGVPSAVLRVLHSGRVWTIQGLGTLLWLALAYAWLWIREAKWWDLAGSALLALFLLYLAAFLQRTALRVYRRERLSVPGAAIGPRAARRRAIREWLPGAVLVALLFAALVWIAVCLRQVLPDLTQTAASWLTLRLRRPVDTYRLQTRVETLFFIGPWFLFVVFWLPLAAAALLGERGLWRCAARAWRAWRYWLSTLACVTVGCLGFWKLAEWVPRARGIPGQSASMVARLGLGYVIALGAWLVILALVEEAIAPVASPDETQDLTPA
jgi:hypothetical protein